ncbi:MAG: hypothetical protein P8020_17235 [Acidobacteriota bacterium]|jgi:hypothetical protein
MAAKPAILTSEGLHPQYRRPERPLVNLAMGIMTQAIRDLISPQQKLDKDWQTWQDDAQAWFDSDERHTGSFEWVCEVLEINPERLRAWVKSLKHLDRKQKKATILSLIRLTYLRPNRNLEQAR